MMPGPVPRPFGDGADKPYSGDLSIAKLLKSEHLNIAFFQNLILKILSENGSIDKSKETGSKTKIQSKI